MTETFVHLYPVVVLLIGLYVAAGTLIGGIIIAVALALDLSGGEVIGRCIGAALANAAGCLCAVGALALTKFFLGI